MKYPMKMEKDMKNVVMKPEAEVEEASYPLHGDILEAILNHVNLIDLVPSSYVSKSWRLSVSSSLRHFNPIKPWLILHTQTITSPYIATTHAFDSRSNVWMEIKQSTIKYSSALRSSHSTLLYMLSPTKFSFSFDPLHLTWHHCDAPLVWRVDPIVAIVGHRVIVAGGTCDFVDDPLAVEIYDLNSRTWDSCETMPSILMDYAASTWLSIAVDEERMYVAQRNSGETYSFDPNAKNWFGPYDLRPDGDVFSSAIGFASGRLILVGLVGTAEDVKSVKMWEVKVESLEWRLIGEMPRALVEKLKGENHLLPSIAITSTGDLVYLHNALDPLGVIVCEIVHGACRWGSLPNTVLNDGVQMQRLVFTTSNVGIGEVQRALGSGNRKFELKY